MPEGSFERPGQPTTMSAQPGWTGAPASAQFASVYARLRAPRVVVLWNREITDDLETDREEVTEFSADSHATASSRERGYNTRRTSNSDIDSDAQSGVRAEVRSSTRRIDHGKRATPLSEAEDFDMERGFVEALSGAGVRLMDRTTIMRATALSDDPANALAVEMRALMGRAEWTIEVTPLSERGETDHARYKIVVRDLSSGTIIAMTASAGQSPPKRMAYVAGPNGFVRATPASQTSVERGRQLADDAMASIIGQAR